MQAVRDASASRSFWEHRFDEDEEYQKGLNSILDSGMLQGKTPEETDAILLQSKIFFWNRTHQQDLNLQDIIASRPEAPSAMEHDVAASTLSAFEGPSTISDVSTAQPPTLTFAQLKELIEQGRTDEIPNNKHIPDVINEDAPSVSTTTARKKPWEIDVV